jgi:putative phosphonate metabolism protein
VHEQPVPRYALYAAPPQGSALAAFGAAVLGYDAATGRPVRQALPPGIEAQDWWVLTEDPRRYGFHGTLKAPFRLAEGCTVDELETACAAFARERSPMMLGLALEQIGPFFALVPNGRPASLHALADDAVRGFDRFRAPMSAAERERRLRGRIGPREMLMLEAWGYPYVLETFRYHMTLSGRVPLELAEPVKAGLGVLVRDGLGSDRVSFALSELCVFEQASPDSQFRIRSRHKLGG